MALTRKALKAMGLTDEQVDSIIEMHTDTVDGLKADISKYKGDAEKLPTVQKELDDLKAAGDDGYKEKYEKEHKAFEDFKTEQSKAATHNAKQAAYKALLKEAGIAEKYLEMVLKVSDVDAVELDGDKIKDADKLKETIKTDFDGFIGTDGTKGADTHNPNPGGDNNPGNDYSKYETMSMADYLKEGQDK